MYTRRGHKEADDEVVEAGKVADGTLAASDIREEARYTIDVVRVEELEI